MGLAMSRYDMKRTVNDKALEEQKQSASTDTHAWSLVDMLSRDVDRIVMSPENAGSEWTNQITDGEEPMSFSSAEMDHVFQTPGTTGSPVLPADTPRTMSFNAAVAPLLTRPTAPFERSERKKALTSAKYYSECFLRGVRPAEADLAASEIQGRFNKWWGKRSLECRNDALQQQRCIFRKHTSFSSRRNDTLGNEQSYRDAHKRKRTAGEDQRHLYRLEKKRRLGRGRMRDIIDDNTLDPYYGRWLDRPEEDLPALQTKRNGVAWRVSSEDDSGNDEGHAFNSPIDLPTALRQSGPLVDGITPDEIESLRDEMIDELKLSGGDTDARSFKTKLAVLHSYYVATAPNHDETMSMHDGIWLSLSKPTFPECLGRNELNHYVYSLGRMSFDMFRPANLVCSIQGTFNSVYPVDPDTDDVPLSIPRRLRKEVLDNLSNNTARGGMLRTHNIVAAFTIEPSHKDLHRPIRGIMTNYGYSLPDPNVRDRVSIWFTGGSLEVNDEDEDLTEWMKIFDQQTLPRRDLQEYARVLAAKVLLGADVSETLESDGTMTYSLSRPIGGHGSAYCDVLYMDEDIRIMRGHHGSVYVFQKVSSSGEKDDLRGHRRRVVTSKAA